MGIRSFLFGTLNGLPVPGFVLDNAKGMQAKVIAYGARLTEMHVPDRDGRLADIVLGFDDLPSYVRHETYFGATCGRFSNRIAAGAFSLDGASIQLERNEGGVSHLHGGRLGFDRRIWSASTDEAANRVLFSLISMDGDQGYPGTLFASASYQLGDDGDLRIRMTAAVDKPSVVNLVHHSYWNLGGHASGSIRDHRLTIEADHYLPVDENLIPTGEVAPVSGTAFDFRGGRSIGAGLDMLAGGAFDHNWCLNGPSGRIRRRIRLTDAASGRGLDVATDQPGVQFYASGALPLDGPFGKSGARYVPFDAVVLETQTFPNAPNVGHFPSARLTPGALYDHNMNFHFFAE
ncbi:galactose-1-epimerase [Telmatospirillum siberiense]|uniref:Aldose 1-epimerase n=2 Tax=Telmatospirillum siberiense TaxID=382514 RepID=A0A2N3PZV0_9PROT|nr:galactose-1-epimerase [Telmatospirillum siberiense]